VGRDPRGGARNTQGAVSGGQWAVRSQMSEVRSQQSATKHYALLTVGLLPRSPALAVYPVATTTPRGLPARGPRSAPGSDKITRQDVCAPRAGGTLDIGRWTLDFTCDPVATTTPAGLPRQILIPARFSTTSNSLLGFFQFTRVAHRVLQVEVRIRMG
jgi:hypothetical protein